MDLVRVPLIAASAIRRGARGLGEWQVWSLRTPLRAYLIFINSLAVAVATAFAVNLNWNAGSFPAYVGLLGCGVIAVESTRTVREVRGIIGRDLQSVWYLAIAITLPPAYAFLAPIPLTAYRLLRVRSVYVYRRVFSNATISLAYGCASVAFHALPPRLAGDVPGTGNHVLTWTGLAACCGAVAWLVNNGLLAGAMRLADRQARLLDLFGSRNGIVSDAIELSLAVSLTLVVAINPVLMALALPSVLLYRRYLMTAQLAAHSRIDTKTGLLNAATWQREAEVEVFRAVRARAPLALVMVDIDNLDSVNETVGRAASDQVLRTIATTLGDEVTSSGLVGRVGDEEFAILLPRTGQIEAKLVGERLRDQVAAQSIAVEDAKHAVFVFRLTVSIGIAVLNESRRALAELISDADSAVATARNSGRNRVYVLPDSAREPGSAAGEREHP